MRVVNQSIRVFPSARMIVALCLGVSLLSALIVNPPRVVHAAAFTSGNLVVVRVGDGVGALGSAAAAVFLDEYTKAGGLVQSIPLPIADAGGNQILTMAGSATSEGALSRSYDGRYLTLAGYDAAPGTAAIVATTSAATNRVVGRADSSGVIDTTTRISDAYSTQNIRSATTNDGTSFWTTGSGSGVRHVALGSAGTSTSITATPANMRVATIQAGYNGFPSPQLHISAASTTFQGVSTVGSGLPTTTGQTTVQLPGFPTTSGPGSYGYIFYDTNAGIAGVDTLYVADDRTTALGGGIQKWTYDGTTWTLAYTLNSGITIGTRGLTGTLQSPGGEPILWATTTESSANRIVTVTDTGAASAFTTIATAATNTAFRGIAFAPTATGGPTAAGGAVSGTITDNNGIAVAGAVVKLSGGQTRKTITNAKGYYQFDNVETTGFYTVTPSRANYSFGPANRSFSVIGNQTDATFTATTNGDHANPLDTPEYFVRQQYLDVLGREPDEGGFNYWSDEILRCGADSTCVDSRRRDVAASFFMAEEFQDTGSYIYDMYKGSLGRQPVFSEYVIDRKQVIGGPSLGAQKAAFADGFVGRTEFVQKYQGNTTAESFVDALLQNVQQSSQVDLGSHRGLLINQYNAGASQNQSRSLVLRALADDALLKEAEYNAAFVLTEYFGYLRRNPEPEGYAFWLNVLNHGDVGNYRGMVCSFITSTEYQQRFSSVVSHSNAECGR